MRNDLESHPSFDFFISCTEVNIHLQWYIYSIRIIYLWILEKKAKVLIKNSYNNEETCGSTRNLERDHFQTYWRLNTTLLLNTIKKRFAQQNINTRNTSDVGQIVKNSYEHVACVYWERDCTKITTLYMFWRKPRAIM